MTELAKVLRAPRAEPELDLEDENCEADQQGEQERFSRMRMDVEDGADPGAAAAAGEATNMDLDLDQINDNLQDLADDNLSLEVQFGDGSSCRASDVSSLSFQNIVFDDNDTPPETMRSRRDSEDSSDSYPNDFTEADTQAFSGQLEKFQRQKRRAQERNSDTSSPTVDDIGDVDEPMGEHEATGTMKRRSKILDLEPESDHPSEEGGEEGGVQGEAADAGPPIHSLSQREDSRGAALTQHSAAQHSDSQCNNAINSDSVSNTAVSSAANTSTRTHNTTSASQQQQQQQHTNTTSSSSSSASASSAATVTQQQQQQQQAEDKASHNAEHGSSSAALASNTASSERAHNHSEATHQQQQGSHNTTVSASECVTAVYTAAQTGHAGQCEQQGDDREDVCMVSPALSSEDCGYLPASYRESSYVNVNNASSDGEDNDNAVSSGNTQQPSVADGGGGMESARNSAEIRNNIPVYRQARDYHHDTATTNTSSSATSHHHHHHHHHASSASQRHSHHLHHAAVPKMKKISPGLARRLGDGDAADGEDSSRKGSTDRDTSSSEKEMDTTLDYTVKSGHALMRAKLENGVKPQPHPQREGEERQSGMEQEGGGGGGGKKYDIENEYDYVKWTRVQEGDAYVGMRLAYSSSNDSLNYKQQWGNGGAGSDDGGRYFGSSRESSPEKIIHQRINEHGGMHRTSNVNEETLTEIPLNGTENGSAGEEQKNFSLSPETTECDSAEVESVLSDEGKSSTSGMPVVEDGLSSSQCSDIDEAFATHDPRRPAEILKQRYKNEVDSQGGTTTTTNINGFEVMCHRANTNHHHSQEELMSQSQSPLSSPCASDSGPNTANKEALDLAIQDIKTAIKRSKSATLKSPYQDDEKSAEEPIWIMRDAYMRKQQRQDEMRRVRDEIERQQEEEYVKEEQERVAELEEDEDQLLKFQFSRNSGKEYQPGKGYESDDEYDDHDRQRQLSKRSSRWNKGRTYAAISTDDVTDHNYLRNESRVKYSSRYTGNFNLHSRYNSKSESSLNNRDSTMHSPGSVSQASRSDTPQLNNSNTSLTNMASMPNSYSTSRGYSSDDSDGKETESRSQTTAFGKPGHPHEGDYDTDEETDQLLNRQYTQSEKIDIPELSRPPVNRSAQAEKRRSRAKEVILPDPDNETVLIEGVLFRARYLGSTQLISEGQPSKAMRMMQAQEAVGRIKAPEGENQPSTEVDLFVSTEKIMVLNTDLQEIMMDHALRTISYIADIGDIVVIMARRRNMTSPADEALHRRKQTKILCHVFESDEAQLIAQSIGQAFSVAYMEFLKANGIEDMGLVKEMDYQEVLNQQEIFGEELFLFSNKEMTKEVIVPKLKGDPLGVVIVESGWGSMVPTVVLANMSPTGAAARCGQLNIGDQIMSVNGVSLVGLPLSSCQNYIKATRNQTVVKLSVVSCAPVVEVCIKRPDVKYQLGFSVQNGVICSLLRGGIAERGGVRVGHRIIEINNNSVVAVQHEKIVNMLATSVGEIHMKTMPTSIYRLLTGQETPHYI